MIMIVVMMVMTMSFYFCIQHLLFKGYGIFHRFKDLFPVKQTDRRRNHCCLIIDFPDQLQCFRNLFLIDNIRTAQNNGSGKLHLVIKKLSEIAHIHFALFGIHYCGITV